ncbi:phosphotransferase family protein [Kitasatospora sp. NPDC093550]|uniref:phosphotransferase family protein n=1 Tax=Kitasatospora sp. NPDC093550 TaxID=3364089 RepID=UPI00380A23F4
MSPAVRRPARSPESRGSRLRSLLATARRYDPLPASPRALLPLRRPRLLYRPVDLLTAHRIARRLGLDGSCALRPGAPGLADVLVLSLDGPAVDRLAVDRLGADRLGAPRLGTDRLGTDRRAVDGVRAGGLGAEGPGGSPARARLAVKHARSGHAVASLDHEWRVLETLADDDRLGGWRTLVPVPVRRELTGRLPLITESWLPGTTADRLLRQDPGAAVRIAERALTAIAGLHRATGRTETATERLAAWVDEPLAVLGTGIPWCRSGTGAAGLAGVRTRLRAGLAGTETTVAWTHADFHAGNVLLDERDGRVTGVIDWGGARPDGPCAIDAYTFVIALICRREGRQLGSAVCEVVRRGALPGPDLALIRGTRAGLVDLRRGGPAGPPDEAVLPLLTWLWHIVSNLTKSPRYARSHWWVTRNVTPLLEEAARWPATRP